MIFVGIDIGTTNCKVTSYDEHGTRFLHSQFPTPCEKLENGDSQYDMEQMWGSLLQKIRHVIRGREHEVCALGVSSQGESCVLTDKEFHPLSKAIPWYDTRTKAIARRWKCRIEPDEIYKITGLELQPIYTILKLEWYKEHMPEVYENAYRFHCMSDYIAGRLTQVHGITESMASRTMAMDLYSRDWSLKLIGLSGLRADIFPEITASGKALGFITPELAADLHIRKDCTVSIAGFDHMAGCLGVGADQENMVLTSMGTTESVCLTADKPELTEHYYGYLWGCHVYAGKYYAIGGLPSGGQTIDWALKNIGNRGIAEEGYDRIPALCSQSPPLSHGVLFLPHLYGCCVPVMDPDSKACFMGITKHTTESDLMRAVIEGLCYEFRMVLERSGNKEVKKMIAIGGGSKNEFWLQCKADVLGIPVYSMVAEDAVTLGSAMTAARGYGADPDKMRPKADFKKQYLPNSENHMKYTRVYQQVYRKLYDMQKQLLSVLDEIVS